jgi:hypothetical protein
LLDTTNIGGAVQTKVSFYIEEIILVIGTFDSKGMHKNMLNEAKGERLL